MVWHHLRGFVPRRLSTEEYLGLHLTVGLLLSLCLLGLFVEIARAVEENRTQFDEHFGQACAQHRQESPVRDKAVDRHLLPGDLGRVA